LRGKLWYYWQLSLEGPLFKVIGACGKRLGRGSFASQCITPKAFKVKVLTEEHGGGVEVAFTPQPPANPFHEEHYVISYCQLSQEGEVGDWIERQLVDDDFFKRGVDGVEGKEKPKEVGRAHRRRLNIPGLPAGTSFRVRVCAEGPTGRSKWSPEVLTSTFAKPNKDQGLTGPLASGAPTTGISVREYRWWQSKHEVGIFVTVPEEWKAKEVTVKVLPRSEATEFKMQHERGMLLSGNLGRNVRVDEVDWVLEKAPEGGKHIAVTLRKEKLMELWECFIDGHQRVDTSQLKLIYEGNSMNELGVRDLWE